MRYLFYIVVGLLFVAVEQGFGTSVPPRPLDWLVGNSEYIFIGVATNLDVTTSVGVTVSSPDAQIAGTDICHLSIQVVEVIKSGTNLPPKVVTVTYSNQWIRTLDGEKQAFLGKRMVYFLRGDDYQPVDAFQFTSPIERLDEIRAFVRKKP